MKQKIIGIYKLTSPSGKCYIGQSTNIFQRFREHKRDKKYKHAKLYNAINKYKYENFVKEIVEECSFGALDERERFWIKHYDSVDNGYNCDYGGQQSKIFSKEHRQKLREAFLGIYNGNQNIEFFIDGVLYASVGTASKKLGIPAKTIHNRLNSSNIKYSNYVYKNVSLIPKRIRAKYSSKRANVNGQIFNSATEASEKLNIKLYTLCRWLRDKKNGCFYIDT